MSVLHYSVLQSELQFSNFQPNDFKAYKIYKIYNKFSRRQAMMLTVTTAFDFTVIFCAPWVYKFKLNSNRNTTRANHWKQNIAILIPKN